MRIRVRIESLQLTAADLKRLDAFQQRGLRRIFGFLPSHLDRTATNQRVLEQARKETMKRRPKQGHNQQLETFSTTIKRRAVALLGHIIRLPDEDPMKQITLRREKPLYPAAKRVGRPKLNWAKQTFQAAWESAKIHNPATPGSTFTAAAEQYENLIHLAKMRRPPFDTKNSRTQHEASSSGPHTTIGASPPGPRTTIEVSSSGPHTTHFVAGAPLAVRWSSTSSTDRALPPRDHHLHRSAHGGPAPLRQ